MLPSVSVVPSFAVEAGSFPGAFPVEFSGAFPVLFSGVVPVLFSGAFPVLFSGVVPVVSPLGFSGALVVDVVVSVASVVSAERSPRWFVRPSPPAVSRMADSVVSAGPRRWPSCRPSLAESRPSVWSLAGPASVFGASWSGDFVPSVPSFVVPVDPPSLVSFVPSFAVLGGSGSFLSWRWVSVTTNSSALGMSTVTVLVAGAIGYPKKFRCPQASWFGCPRRFCQAWAEMVTRASARYRWYTVSLIPSTAVTFFAP